MKTQIKIKSFLTRLRGLAILSALLTLGVGNAWGAAPTGWTQVTSLSGIAANDIIIIVTNDGNKYLNGSVRSGHFSTTSLTSSAPASSSAAGVIKLVSTGTANTYKLQLVSTSKYVTATKASSGGGSVSATSDSDGWKFTSSSSGQFDAQFQASGKQAYCRSYNNSSFRTYGNNTSNGATFQIYKYSSVTTYTVTYELNGGSGTTPTESNKAKDATFTLHDGTTNITAPSGKMFSKWKDQDDVEYNGGATYTMPAKNVTLTAQWVDLPKYTVTLKDDNSTLTQATAGGSVTLPTRTGCTGFTFAGWTSSWTSAQTSWTTTAPTIIPAGSYTPTANENLYPVYTKTEGSGSTPATLAATYSSHTGWTASNCGGSSYWILDSDASITSPTIDDLSTITSIVIKTRTYGGSSYKTVNVSTSGGTSVGSINATSTTLSNYTISTIPTLSGSGTLIFSSSTTTTSNGPGVSEITINYSISASTTSYISVPNCCTPLGAINGSIIFINVLWV